MERSVGSSAHVSTWDRARYARAISEAPGGGRTRRPRDLYGWMFPLAGLIFLANFFSLVDLPVAVEYLLAGIMFGTFTGKSVVVWRERGGSALEPDRVRQIEQLWVLVGVAVAALAILAQVAGALAQGGFA